MALKVVENMEDTEDRFQVDYDYVDEVYLEISTMDVELDPNPLELGPSRLNNKIADVRNMLSRAQRIYLQVSKDLAAFRRQFRLLDAEFQLRKDDMLFNDVDVRAARSATDREAFARAKLRDLITQIQKVEGGVQELDVLAKVVRSKITDLRDLQTRLKDQVRLCMDEIIRLNANWGSKSPEAAPLPRKKWELPSRKQQKDEEVVDQILEDSEETTAPPEAPEGIEVDFKEVSPAEALPDESVKPAEEAGEMDQFLSALDVEGEEPPAPPEPEPEFDDLDLDALLS